jgi:shikimate dehydrogenase
MYWRLGVAGSPITHSLSPRLHQTGLTLAGLEGTSRYYEVGATDVARLGEMLGRDVDALSVTMPLKALAAGLCQELDETARRLGVVSSLLWREDRIWGAATDGPGFVDSLRGEFATSPEGTNVVILGAGGAARAIVDSVVLAGARSVVVLGRSEASVRAVVALHSRVVDHLVPGQSIDLVVNTTPATGRDDSAPVLEGVSAETIAVDITYEPRHSAWLQRHAARGCRHANGLAMLAYQAARQMNWWWHRDLDGARLLEAIT